MVLALSIIYRKDEVKVYVCEHCGGKKQPTFLMCHYPDLGGASDWSCSEGNLLHPFRSTTQIDLGSDGSSV